MGIKIENINQRKSSVRKQDEGEKKSLLAILNQDISFNQSYPDKKKEQFIQK